MLLQIVIISCLGSSVLRFFCVFGKNKEEEVLPCLPTSGSKLGVDFLSLDPVFSQHWPTDCALPVKIPEFFAR